MHCLRIETLEVPVCHYMFFHGNDNNNVNHDEGWYWMQSLPCYTSLICCQFWLIWLHILRLLWSHYSASIQLTCTLNVNPFFVRKRNLWRSCWRFCCLHLSSFNNCLLSEIDLHSHLHKVLPYYITVAWKPDLLERKCALRNKWTEKDVKCWLHEQDKVLGYMYLNQKGLQI